MDGVGPDACEKQRQGGRVGSSGAGACRGSGIAPVDAGSVSPGFRGYADLRQPGEEPAAAWAVCHYGWERGAALDADPAAWLSAVSGALLQAVWRGQLHGGSLR